MTKEKKLLLLTEWRIKYTISDYYYKAFHRFGQAKFPDSGSVLGSSQFSILPKLPPKTMLSLKEVKIDSKMRNSLC